MLEDKQRLFLVVCHRSLPTCACQFRLNSLVDSRLDLVANCVTSAILKSRATRRDTSVRCFPWYSTATCFLRQKVCFLFNDNTSQGFWLLIVDGDKVRHIRPDERNIASIIQKRVYNGCSCTAQEHIRIGYPYSFYPLHSKAKVDIICLLSPASFRWRAQRF